jgi:uncharacterized protein DUF6272
LQKESFIDLMVDIDNVSIVDYNGLITQDSIVDIAKTIETALIDYGEIESKVRNIFLIIIEIMQNILNYSYSSIKLDNNKSQSNGSVKIICNQDTKIYNILSENIISLDKKESILSLINEVNSLDEVGLKMLYKERRRSKSNNHKCGAGLGFLDMARKSKNKIGIQFLKNDENSLIFKLQITI